MNDDAGLRQPSGQQHVRGLGRCSGGHAVLVATVAIALAACGPPSPAHVASLGKPGGSATTAGSSAAPTGDATQLLITWADCMRAHGDPDQAVPTIVDGEAIKILTPASYHGPMIGPTGENPTGPGVTCEADLTAAQAALNGGQPPSSPDQADQVKWAECMQANGVPNYPAPGAGPANRASAGSVPDLNSPAFVNAVKVCTKKTGQQMPNPGAGIVVPGEVELYASDGMLQLVGF